MHGEGLIGLAFLVALIYAVARSRKRLATILYCSLGFVVGLAIFMGIAYFSPLTGEAAGYIGSQCGLLFAMLTALVHSRKSREVATSGHLPSQP